MATSEIDGKGLTKKMLVDFYDAGHNVFMAGDIDSSKFFRQIYNEFGVEFDDFGSAVYDHFNTLETTDNSVIYSDNIIKHPVFNPSISKPILYAGAGLATSNYETF